MSPPAFQASAETGAVVGLARQDFGAIIDPHQQHDAVGIADRHHLLLRMAGDHLDRASERREHRGVLPIGPSLPWNGHRMSWVEPEVASHLPPAVQSNERTARRSPTSACACGRRDASHAASAPACGDQKAAVRAERHAEMRALPFELFRRGRAHSETRASRRCNGRSQDESPSAQRPARRQSRHFQRARRPCGAHERLLACRPRDGAVRAERDMVDPAALGVGRERLCRAVRRGRHDLAVVAAGDDALAVAPRTEDRAAMTAIRRSSPSRGRTAAPPRRARRRPCAEKMRGDDRRAGIDRPRALDDGRDARRASVTASGHAALEALRGSSPPAGCGR